MEVYICTKCGKSFDSATKFCADCGGRVETVDSSSVKFVCEKCGKEFPEKWNYCHDCAGRIVTTIPYSYVCDSCGKSFEKETKFCSECGGRISRHGGVIGEVPRQEKDSRKEAAKPEPTVAVEPKKSSASFCPGCGSNTLVDGFCTNCGYSSASPAKTEKSSPKADFCPGCGNNTLVDGFCTNCGYQSKK